jgi:hypothetical protein
MSEQTEKNSNHVLFLDSVGRTILGESVENTANSNILKVKNPVVIMINGDKTGRMSVQLFPLFFREFLADKESDVVLSYLKDKITESNIDTLDFRLQAQYSQMFNKNNTFVPPQEQPAQQTDGGVINLFDE